jgi:hypothetical protein
MKNKKVSKRRWKRDGEGSEGWTDLGLEGVECGGASGTNATPGSTPADEAELVHVVPISSKTRYEQVERSKEQASRRSDGEHQNYAS